MPVRRTILKAFSIAAFLAVPAAASAQEMRIGTASLGGAFYPVGQGISNLVNKYAKGLRMVPVVTGGSVQNPRLVGKGEVDIAITNNNLAVLAVNGKGPYKSGKIDIKAVAALHPSVLHMVVLEGSAIKTFADIKGKRVAVGPAGGGTLGFLRFLMPMHGMKFGDITASFLSYGDGFSQLSDGNVEAAFALSGYPASAVMQAGATKKLRFIKFADGMLDKAIARNKAFSRVVIPKSVYKTDEDPVVIGVNNMLIVPSKMPAEKVYAITKAVFDHLDEFRKENANARQINPADSLKLAIPLHEGAARYFKNKK